MICEEIELKQYTIYIPDAVDRYCSKNIAIEIAQIFITLIEYIILTNLQI